MRKIMGDGCWLQFPQRLREPGPGSVLDSPPPHRILYVSMWRLAKYIQLLWPFGQSLLLSSLSAQWPVMPLCF
jgi:hypothetical protein